MKAILGTFAVIALLARFAAAQEFNPVIDAAGCEAALAPVPAPQAAAFAGGRAAADPQRKLEALFESGIPAAEKDLAGWHSGRAYDAARKVFTGALLAYWKAPAAENTGGPLFQQPAVPMAVVMSETAPDFFDAMPYDQVLRVRYAIESRERVFMLKFPGGRAVYEDAGAKIQLEERIAGGYIVERMTVLDKADGTTREAYAYYFRNVTPKK